MKKRKRTKRKKVDRYANLLSLYQDPSVAGSLGGVARFAKARKLPVAQVREKLEKLHTANIAIYLLLLISIINTY